MDTQCLQGDELPRPQKRENKSLELEEPPRRPATHTKQRTDRSGTEREDGRGSREGSGQKDTLQKGL